MADNDGFRVDIEGVAYRSLDDVPEKYRAFAAPFFEDEDGDGVPDIVQGAGAAWAVTTERSETYIVDGTEYSSIDEVSESHRGKMARMTDTPPARPITSGRPSSGERPVGIVSNAGPSSRTKMFLAFAAIGVVVLSGVIWLLAR